MNKILFETCLNKNNCVYNLSIFDVVEKLSADVHVIINKIFFYFLNLLEKVWLTD